MGVEAEVSAAICFLLSPGAAFITGVTLPSTAAHRWAARCSPTSITTVPALRGFHRAVLPRC